MSIVIPTFNRSSRLVRALSSVKAQTYRPLEVIVVDDGSNDDTAEAVETWSRENSEPNLVCRYIKQPNRGAPTARNLGLIESTGSYIQYLDSDDIILPKKIERHVSVLKENNGVDLVWSQLKVVDELKLLQSVDPVDVPGEYYFMDAQALPDATYVALLKRDVCIAAGPWDESLICRQDTDYRFKLEALSPKAYYVPEVLNIATIHDTGRINDKYASVEGIKAQIKVINNAKLYMRVANKDYDFYGMYLSAAKAALKTRNSNLIRLALTELQSNCGPSRRRWVKALNRLYAIAGAATASKSLELYGRLRRSVFYSSATAD